MKLLITGAWNATEEQLNKLRTLGHDVIYLQDEKANLSCPYSQIEGVICNNLFLYHNIKEFTSLKFIQFTSAGLDRVPLDYIKSHNINYYNAGGVYSIPMAEFAVSGVLQLYKQSNFFRNNQKNHKWGKHRGLLEINGKTVGIIGCGSVGTECAKRFNAFGAKVIGVDILPRVDENYITIYSIEELDKVLEISDIVIISLPLTKDTANLFDQKKFEIIKDHCVLVNISRGKIVQEDTLLNALDNKLMGAVLDVFETEPLNENNPLWEKENVIITPHNSFVSDGNCDRMFKLILKNIGEL